MIITAVPPFVFWNLLGLVSFHLGILWVLRRRLRQGRSPAESPLSPLSPSRAVLAVVPLRQVGPQEMAAVRSLLGQTAVSHRLLLCLDSPLMRCWRQAPQAAGPEQPWLQQLQQEAVDAGVALDLCGLDDLAPSWDPAPLESRAIARGLQWLASEPQPSPSAADPDEILVVISPQLVPPADWLQQLTQPLANPAIAATTVYPWQRPFLALSPLFQYAWNGFAVQQLVLLPPTLWGGAIALRSACLSPARLQRWQALGASDIALGHLLRQEQLKLLPLLHLMAHRRTRPSLAAQGQEIRQRLSQLKRYHPLWPVLAAQGVFVSVTTLRAYFQVFQQVFEQVFNRISEQDILPTSAVNLWLLLAIALYGWTVAALLCTLELFARRPKTAALTPSRNHRPGADDRAGTRPALKFLFLSLWLVAPLAQLVHCLTTVWIVLPPFLKAQAWAKSGRHPRSTQPINLRKS